MRYLGVSQTTQPEGVEIIETDLSTVLSSFSDIVADVALNQRKLVL